MINSYNKWMIYFLPHLEKMFKILPQGYSFEEFCIFVYKKSSKNIPKY